VLLLQVARRLAAKHKELSKMGVVADRGLQRGDVAVLDLSAVKLNDDGSEGEEVCAASTTISSSRFLSYFEMLLFGGNCSFCAPG